MKTAIDIIVTPIGNIIESLDRFSTVLERDWTHDDTTPEQDRRFITAAHLLREATTLLKQNNEEFKKDRATPHQGNVAITSPILLCQRLQNAGDALEQAALVIENATEIKQPPIATRHAAIELLLVLPIITRAIIALNQLSDDKLTPKEVSELE